MLVKPSLLLECSFAILAGKHEGNAVLCEGQKYCHIFWGKSDQIVAYKREALSEAQKTRLASPIIFHLLPCREDLTKPVPNCGALP